MQLRLEFDKKLVDHSKNDCFIKRLEGDDGVEPIAELGREDALDLLHLVTGLTGVTKADNAFVQHLRAGVGGHDNDDASEIGLAPVIVGEGAMVHDLQQNVEDVGVRLLNFVEQ